MTLIRWRRSGTAMAVALATAACYFGTTLRSTPAFAAESTEPAQESSATAAYDRSSRAALAKQESEPASSTTASAPASSGEAKGVEAAQSALEAPPAAAGGVSPSAAALPTGAATQLGMGESFTMQLSTGAIGYSVPIALPPARGHAQPNLALSYSSGGGSGLAGIGWNIGAPAVERQTDRGLPLYDDRATWHANQDRFVLAGMELVPICTVTGGACTGAQSGEKMPTWAEGWQYFRSRVDGAFMRTFWSPDHRTWRVQSKDGTTLELGVPLDGSGYEGALERNPDATNQIFRWHIARQYDMQATSDNLPLNAVVYRYTTDSNVVYLTDVFDTSPASAPTTSDLSQFAHHEVLTYETRPDSAASYRTGYRALMRWRVSGIDVTSKPFTGGSAAARELLRRYHLNYDATSHRSLLTSVVAEGRCTAAVREDANQRLPATTCPTLPPVTFEYQRVAGGVAAAKDSQGRTFEPFDTTIRTLGQSPPRSLDEPDTGLADINGDGLPDLLSTKPGLFGGSHGVYLNGSDGAIGFGAPLKMPVLPTADVPDAGVLVLHNPTVAALDYDADGLVDLVHMPSANRYSVFSPVADGKGGFVWSGREITTASQQSVKVNLAQQSPNVAEMDVNGDGLVDVVYSSPTELQTFFSLGRFPGGDAQFGTGAWTSASTAQLGNAPVVNCPPWSGTPVRLSDPDVHVADMNADGLPDLVRVRDGQILYWPGRGNGFFGTGDARGCGTAQAFAVERHIAMANPPRFGTYDEGSLLLADVSGDGLPDLVIVRSQAVEIFLNDNGTGWTAVSRLENTPFRPAGRSHVRLTDIDGSGTPDVLWGLAGEYRYIDLTGGALPHLLTKVKNGLGQTLDVEYKSSAAQMLAAATAKAPWSTTAPTLTPVVSRTIMRDHLEVVGRPGGAFIREFTYRDPVYEGRQREFRGFSDVTVKSPGDANTPTVYDHSVFQLGECSLQFTGTSADVCAPAQRWRDNWREALKGLPVLHESYDDSGVYTDTEHTTYELRQLYAGVDGRGVVSALPVAKDQLVYDTGSFDAKTGSLGLDEVVVTIPGLVHNEVRPVTMRATTGTAHLQAATVYDSFGNVTDAIQRGCISGCPGGVDEIITSHSDYTLPANDPSGWLWRERHSYVKGSVDTSLRNETIHTFDAHGNLATSYNILSGSLALDYHHAVAGAAVAPQPPGRSGGTGTAVQILMEGPVYDQFGNTTFDRGAAGRCSNRDYDDDYKQLPVVERLAGGAVDSATQCGANLFAHRVTYDRGLGQVIDSFDPRNQPSRYAYDGFGRTVSITHANPSNPGTLATQPSLKVSYALPANPDTTPYVMIDVQSQDGANPNVSSYREEQIFRDGLGREIVTFVQADPTAGDGGAWVAAGFVDYDARGNPARNYDPFFFTGTTSGALAGPPAATPYKSQEFDAFGRPSVSFGRDHVVSAMVVPHASSTDLYDAADVLATTHQGTYSTTVVDGHGRTIQKMSRIKVGSAIEQRSVLFQFSPTSEVLKITQRRAGSTDVVRTMSYDSLGRRVSNTEPNTTSGALVWRYAYDDAGRLVGISDARGCGANYAYDVAGRLLAQDRSPCLASQPAYTAPNLTTGDGTEAFYRYDAADPEGASIVDGAGHALAIDTSQLWGHMASAASLGAKSIFSFDALTRVVGVGVRVQKPGAPASQLSARYAAQWFVKATAYDAADRVISEGTGATTPELMGTDGTSALRPTYTKRGLVRQYGSSYGVLQASSIVRANGLTQSFTLGDAAATHRDLTYDTNLRLKTAQTVRLAAPLWSAPPAAYTPPVAGDDPTRQLLLENRVFSYDEVGNLVRDEDNRTAADWPASAKPVTRAYTYDDLYRLTRTQFSFSGGADTWKSPYAAENQTATLTPQPSPHVSFANRVSDQQFQYDWLGNMTQGTDDQQAFWDRSTGTRVPGTATVGPNQVLSASNRTLAPTSTAKGDLSAGYDVAGNLTGLIVRRDGACLPAAASCWQRFAYEWDEIGQLSRARRWDLTSGTERTNYGQLSQAVPTRTANADLSYGYDERGARVLKTAVDAAARQSLTLYPLGALEVRSTTFDTTTGAYVVDANTTSLRIAAGGALARVIYAPQNLPAISSGKQHVLLELSDRIASTGVVVDLATGELVEAATYQSYGAIESDYRPARWGSRREPYKFGGKEEDIEVGLSYFGARYYSPYLAVWISPDPTTIHELGADTNPYGYGLGSPQMGTDADGRIFGIDDLLVVLAIVAISAAVAASTNAATQAQQNGGWDNIDWGGVAVSAAIGAGTSVVSMGVGSVVTPFVTAALTSALGATTAATVGAVTGSVAGGVAGSAAGYTAGHARGGFSWGGLGQSMVIGGLSAGAGSGTGLSVAAQGWGPMWSSIASASASATTGYVTAVGMGQQQASWQSFGLSLGSGLAASVATTYVASGGNSSSQSNSNNPNNPNAAPEEQNQPPPIRLVRSPSEGGGDGPEGAGPGGPGGPGGTTSPSGDGPDVAPEVTLRGSNRASSGGVVTDRGEFTEKDLQKMHDEAQDGPNGGKMCGNNCGREVMKKPGEEGRGDEWHGGHNPSWTNREGPVDATRRYWLNLYKQNTFLICKPCNLANGNRDR